GLRLPADPVGVPRAEVEAVDTHLGREVGFGGRGHLEPAHRRVARRPYLQARGHRAGHTEPQERAPRPDVSYRHEERAGWGRAAVRRADGERHQAEKDPEDAT